MLSASGAAFYQFSLSHIDAVVALAYRSIAPRTRQETKFLSAAQLDRRAIKRRRIIRGPLQIRVNLQRVTSDKEELLKENALLEKDLERAQDVYTRAGIKAAAAAFSRIMMKAPFTTASAAVSHGLQQCACVRSVHLCVCLWVQVCVCVHVCVHTQAQYI